MMRPTLAIAVSLAVVIATACGGAAQPAPSPTQTQAAATAAATQAPATAAPAATASTQAAVDALAKAAAQEGSLVFYTALDPDTAKKVGDAFGAKYKVKVEFTRGVSGVLTARYASEAQSGLFAADLMIISADPFFADALGKGWIQKMSATVVPEAANIPKRFVYDGTVAIGVARSSNVLINTNLVKGNDVPKSWQDLLSPQWKGQLYTVDPRNVPVALASWQVLAEKLGESYAKQLAAQQINYQASMVTGVQLIGAGERRGGFGGGQVHLNPLLATAPNAPVKIIPLTGPEFGYEWHAGISSKSKNQNAARLFVHWLLTPEGQDLLNKNIGNSVRPDVTFPGNPAISSDFISLDTTKALKSRAQILQMIGLPD